MKKSQVTWLSRDNLVREVKKHIQKAENVLDIGCGIIPQTMVPARLHICVEPYEEYVNHLLNNYPPFSRHKYLVIQSDWAGIIPLFPKQSIDTVILTDVIEHLKKEEGKKLLKQTLNIARKQIIIGTPIGLTKQFHSHGKDAWGYSGVKWQEHQSGWSPDDFDSTWQIYACKKFHMVDNLGRKLKKPEGTFFAIKNISYKDLRGTFMKESSIYLRSLFKSIITKLYYLKQRISGGKI